jgi:CDP-glucose 4,6-dehydratase
MNLEFWENKRVFVTGHTGFKGGWTVMWLEKLGAIVKGYSLEPDLDTSLFDLAKIDSLCDSHIADIRDLKTLKKSIIDFEPHIVIHMAAQPLVRVSYIDPVETYQVNVMGTVNLFEAVRESKSVKAVLNVTTDKCYHNNEWVWSYRENEPMGGHDPYSSSKGCSELITSAYQKSFFNMNSNVSLASARAGNVIGGGDWSKDRLIPDALKAFNSDQKLVIRNPFAIRPWQHVLEPVSGYLELIEKLYNSNDEYSEGWNFGPEDKDCIQVSEVIKFIADRWPSQVIWEEDLGENLHEAQLLKLDISKSKNKLSWKPRWGIEKALDTIIQWHQSWNDGLDMKDITLSQINDYEKLL